jgi:hypothetical protein
MIRNVWSVLCRDILTDQESNTVSYLRCIEEGAAPSLPVHIGPVFLGTLWEKTGTDPETVAFRVVLVSPARQRQAILQSRPVVMERPRTRLQFRLNALKLTEFGLYALLVEFKQKDKWETAASLPILIRPTE